MPSLEMLKKLLDEFTEKEAHTREEINVINEQIGELEKRIVASQAKLASVAVDREKVRTMQARYGGGSTLTTGPLVGGSPTDKKEEPRPRPGRAGSTGGMDVGIPPAPLNVRASSTRIPAMQPPEPIAVPEPTPEPAASSPFMPTIPEPAANAASPFMPTIPEPAAAAPAPSNTFSPLDIFGTPTDEIPTSTPPVQPASSPAAALNSFSFGEPQPASPAPADVQYNTGSAQIDIGLPANYNQQAQSDVGVQTSDSPFYKPLGVEALQPAASDTQAAASDPAAQAAQAAAAQEDAQVSDLEDEPDDTVKSINDALRGLFR